MSVTFFTVCLHPERRGTGQGGSIFETRKRHDYTKAMGPQLELPVARSLAAPARAARTGRGHSYKLSSQHTPRHPSPTLSSKISGQDADQDQVSMALASAFETLSGHKQCAQEKYILRDRRRGTIACPACWAMETNTVNCNSVQLGRKYFVLVVD
jgi:hypothetical protein